MMERIAETSPCLNARIAGARFLLAMPTGIFAQGFVSGSIAVEDDPAATTTDIRMHERHAQI
jgi:hypothetical protein